MKTPIVLSLLAAVAAFAAAPASAQDAPPPAAPPSAAPPAAGAEAQEAPEKPSDSLHAFWDAMKAIQEERKAAVAAKDQPRVNALGAAYNSARGKFNEEFAKADWNALDPAVDGDLLGSGLLAAGQDALRKGDGKAAVRAFGLILEKTPTQGFAKAVGASLLPSAHMAAGDLPAAIALWEKYCGDADPGIAGMALVSLGDARCAQGNLAGARNVWQKAAEAKVSDDPREPGAGPKKDAVMRLALVGSPAPEIDSKTWLGAEAVPLSKLRGSVVVVDFWATWCPPCRAVMPGLNEIYGKRRKDGLAVVGVTRVYPNGFMPRKGTKEPLTDGERVAKIAESDFPAHLAQFKENVGIDYPFVTGTEEDFKNYRVSGIPTMFVLDREGKVAFVKVGSGDETLLHMTLERLLAPPQASAEPPK